MENKRPIYIKFQEACITDEPLTIQEAQTLYEHLNYLNTVRERLGKPLLVSRKSGRRTFKYEKRMGRSGNSEHATFNFPRRGAIDLVNQDGLIDLLIRDGFYTRICVYPNNGFIHCDRKIPRNLDQEPKINDIFVFKAQSPSGVWIAVDYKDPLHPRNFLT